MSHQKEKKKAKERSARNTRSPLLLSTSKKPAQKPRRGEFGECADQIIKKMVVSG